jgi:hypothetical protein
MKKKAASSARIALPVRKPVPTSTPAQVDEATLLADLRGLIQSARQRVATVANATTTMLCWHVGHRLLKDNLQDGRAAYGKRILATVSQVLTAEFGQGFTYSALTRMIRFAECLPDKGIVSTLSTQLSWSHFMELLPIKDPLARDFYAEMCRIERWDVRTLRKKIGGMLYQRTALSKNTKAVISAEIANLRDGRMTPDTVFRDPYFLDLLGLKGAYSEQDLVGQMEFYLRWLDKYERAPGEEAPIGLILCASSDVEQVELLQLDAKSIRVSEYLTELPPLKMLQTRLHQALEHAREQVARRPFSRK